MSPPPAVERTRSARLATVRPDGSPHIVPITFALLEGRIVTAVDHKPKTTTRLQRLRNIEQEPRVAVLFDHYQDDWSGLWWVRADGVADIVEPGSERHANIVAALAARYHQYRSNPLGGQAIVITVESWSSWSGGA